MHPQRATCQVYFSAVFNSAFQQAEIPAAAPALSNLLQQPSDGPLLQFQVRRDPQGMNGMSHGCENDAPLAVLISPARYRFLPVVLILEAVDVLGFDCSSL